MPYYLCIGLCYEYELWRPFSLAIYDLARPGYGTENLEVFKKSQYSYYDAISPLQWNQISQRTMYNRLGKDWEMLYEQYMKADLSGTVWKNSTRQSRICVHIKNQELCTNNWRKCVRSILVLKKNSLLDILLHGVIADETWSKGSCFLTHVLAAVCTWASPYIYTFYIFVSPHAKLHLHNINIV